MTSDNTQDCEKTDAALTMFIYQPSLMFFPSLKLLSSVFFSFLFMYVLEQDFFKI